LIPYVLLEGSGSHSTKILYATRVSIVGNVSIALLSVAIMHWVVEKMGFRGRITSKDIPELDIVELIQEIVVKRRRNLGSEAISL
jgi:hypothetical protein